MTGHCKYCNKLDEPENPNMWEVMVLALLLVGVFVISVMALMGIYKILGGKL